MALSASTLNRPLAPNRDEARERVGEQVADHTERFLRWQWFFLAAKLDLHQATNGQARLEAVSRAQPARRSLPPPIVVKRRSLPPPIVVAAAKRKLPPPIRSTDVNIDDDDDDE